SNLLKYLEKIKESNDTTRFFYTLDEVQKFIAKQFQDSEDSSEQLDPSLVESVFPNQEFQSSTQNLEAAKKSFHQLANILILPLEYASGYYWKMQQIYLNTNKKKLTGCATVYLGCTQCEDRQWQRPENMPVKRRRNTIVTIDPQQQCALVQCSHQLAYEHPQYRQVEFPVVAKEWIRDKNTISRALKYMDTFNNMGLLMQRYIQRNKCIIRQQFLQADIHVPFNKSALINKKYLEEHQGFKVIYYV
ncbi:24957_t:CDS:2, partial [Gigaspora margarita]